MNESLLFRSAASGLWYSNPNAAGSIDRVKVDDIEFAFSTENPSPLAEPDSGIHKKKWLGDSGIEKVFGKPDAPSDHVEHVLQKALDKVQELQCHYASIMGWVDGPYWEKLIARPYELVGQIETILLSEHRSGSEVSGVAEEKLKEHRIARAFYWQAIDDIYNDGEEGRDLVIKHFGLWHPPYHRQDEEESPAPSAPSSAEQKGT